MSDPNSSSPSSDDRQSEELHGKGYDHLLKPIPDHWRFVTSSRKNGSRNSYYLCPETKQRFRTYEEVVRYVHYAEEALVSIYNPYFCGKPRKGDIPADSQLLGMSYEVLDSNQAEEDSLQKDANSDLENFDAPDDFPAEEPNLNTEKYKMPPMDSIVLLPIESEKEEQERRKWSCSKIN